VQVAKKNGPSTVRVCPKGTFLANSKEEKGKVLQGSGGGEGKDWARLLRNLKEIGSGEDGDTLLPVWAIDQ